MTYRISSYEALTNNIAAANTTVMLCRANIERIPMTTEERKDLDRRVGLQIRELQAMHIYLARGSLNPSAPTKKSNRQVKKHD